MKQVKVFRAGYGQRGQYNWASQQFPTLKAAMEFNLQYADVYEKNGVTPVVRYEFVWTKDDSAQ